MKVRRNYHRVLYVRIHAFPVGCYPDFTADNKSVHGKDGDTHTA